MAQIKVSQISKDFNIKSKDVIEIFKSLGLEKKTGASVEAEEYELFLHSFTFTHQIRNIKDYTEGKTKITVVTENKEEAPATVKAEAKAPEAPKVEKKVAEAPKAEPEKKVQDVKPVEKPAPKAPAKDERREFTPERRGDRPMNNRPAQPQGRDMSKGVKEFNKGTGYYPKYSDRPSDDPFAKRRNDMNRAAEGFKRPDGQNNGAQRNNNFRQDIKPQAKPQAPT